MHLLGTHRSAARRLWLAAQPGLGAGNFFWYAWKIDRDRDRPLLFTADVDVPGWEERMVGRSMRDIRREVIRYATWYRRQGVTPSSRVGVYTRWGINSLLHHIAITSLGAAAVHCNPRMPAGTAAEYFLRTDVALVMADEDLLGQCTREWAAAQRPAARTPAAHDITEADREPVGPDPRLPDFPHRHRPGDLVMISHSSGTTGRPKAPVFHHRGFFVGKRERFWTFPSLRTDRLLTALPHSHSAGLSYLSLAVMLGVPVFLLDNPAGSRVTAAVNGFRPTVVLGFPLALAEIDPAALLPEAAAGIHTWNGMGDASHERHIRPLVALGSRTVGGTRVPGSTYLDGLGSSEMGMVLFKQAYSKDSTRYGRLIGTPARVVRRAAALDATGRELPAGQAGLLGVRTPSVTAGYWDDPKLTQESLLNGYFLTGDVVRRDEQGRWYHLDRTPDVIKTAGGDVYSLQLEEVVLLATLALDAAVVAVEDPGTPGAFCPAAVVYRPGGAERSAEELLSACNTALDAAGLPRLRALMVAADRGELPVGVTGKVLKRELRERHADLLRRPAASGTATAAAPARVAQTG